ncbi:hypothetical protein [Oceanicaulis alexandrii]|uniref:hypothetical protein n=1 Tax=Oceanicaulis alexandrii TaxID=153233 RepID=UPI0023553DF9|nr:hypothetical protein [Oceanicaulis alexandrii]
MSDNDQMIGADDGLVSEFATGPRETRAYETESEKPTRKELGLILESERVQEAQHSLETLLSGFVGWTRLGLFGLALFVIGVVCDVFQVTPILFERLLGCDGPDCGYIASISLANLVNWGVSSLGLVLSFIGLTQLHFQYRVQLRKAFTVFMDRFRSREAMRPVFIGSGRVKVIIDKNGLQVQSAGRLLSLEWRTFDGVDLLFDEHYNPDPPESFANKAELERLELEDFLHSPNLPEPLEAFRAQAAQWARRHTILALPLRLQSGDLTESRQQAKNRAQRAREADVEKMRDYLVLPRRLFRNTIEGLDWETAVPAILYMIYSRDPSVIGTRAETLDGIPQ